MARKLKQSPKKIIQSGDIQPIMISSHTDKYIWKPVNSTWNSTVKPEAIWEVMMSLTEPVSQTQTSFVLCLRLIYFDVFVCFNPVPLLYLIPVRWRTWYISPLSVMLSLLSWCSVLPSSLTLSLRPFLFHNKPLAPLCHRCLLCSMDFLPFQFRFPAAE